MSLRTLGLAALAVVLSGARPALAAASVDAARHALADAEGRIAVARDCEALWTTAVTALSAARAALRDGRYELSVEAAHEAATLANLGIRQRQSAPDGGAQCAAVR